MMDVISLSKRLKSVVLNTIHNLTPPPNNHLDLSLVINTNIFKLNPFVADIFFITPPLPEFSVRRKLALSKMKNVIQPDIQHYLVNW